MSKRFQILCLILLAVVLAALVWAALVAARERHRVALCNHNLGTLGLACALYANEDRLNRCPTDGPMPTLAGSLRLLTNYNILVTGRFLFCPSESRPYARAARELAKVGPANISYSYVPHMVWHSSTPDSPLALDRIYTTKAGSSWPKDGNHRGRGGAVLFSAGRTMFCAKLPAALKDADGNEIVLSP
jgi:hypothetical protein